MLPVAKLPDYVIEKIAKSRDFLASMENQVEESLQDELVTDAELVGNLQRILGRLRYHLSQVAIDCACGMVPFSQRPDYTDGRELETDIADVIKKFRSAI